MSKKHLLAAVLALSTGMASADDQTVAFNGLEAKFVGIGSLFAGGSDVITFTGLANGVYDFIVTFSSQYVNLTAADLNAQPGQIQTVGAATFMGVIGQGNAPFQLTLTGSVADAARANYTGEISVSAVPEPQTYALMLAGLAAIGFIARRRRG